MRKNTLLFMHVVVLLIVCIALSFSVGCTSDESTDIKVTETQATGELTPSVSGEAVHYTELMKFLPTATSN